MSFGLGRNSPVILSQSRENFIALIERHGQWLRWRVAKKCPCVTSSNRPDIHCKKCGGSGDIYDYQREYDDIFRAVVRDSIIVIPETHTDSLVLEVYDSKGRRFEFTRRDNFLLINNKDIPNNELVDVRVRVPIVKIIEHSMLEKVGGGYYRVPKIVVEPSKIQGVYYRAAGDVISVESLVELKDDEEKPVNVLGLRHDLIYTDSNADIVMATNIEYVLPFRFIVLSQNLSKADTELVNAHNGDALCTFPYMFNLSENDIITVLSGAMTHKIVTKKRGKDIDDKIPEYFISQIDSIETNTGIFKEGEDFVLVGTNTIHWIGKQPEDVEMMSITYRYFPTYRVAKEIPMLRTSEDQRIPKKVALRLFGAFAEARGVNRND
jgi:hypothetical protein